MKTRKVSLYITKIQIISLRICTWGNTTYFSILKYQTTFSVFLPCNSLTVGGNTFCIAEIKQ